MIGRKPKNLAEGLLWEDLVKRGWRVTKRGWPDFFAMKDGEIALIEVKHHKGHPLKGEQALIMQELTKRDIPCYLWTPEDGFTKFSQRGE